MCRMRLGIKFDVKRSLIQYKVHIVQISLQNHEMIKEYMGIIQINIF